MRRFQRQIPGALGLLCVLAVLGCGSGGGQGGSGGDGGGGGGGPGLPSGGPDILGIPNYLVPVQVTVPPGYVGGPDALLVVTSGGEARPDPQGMAQVPAYDGGPQLAACLDGDGTPVLLGWVPPANGAPGPHRIDVQTTAEVLVYLFAHGFLATSHDQEAFIRRLHVGEEAAALSDAIRDALEANPKLLAGHDAALLQVLHETVDALLATIGGSPVLRKTDVDPDSRESGIRVVDGATHQVRVENSYARRCVALLERKSYVSDGVETPAYEDLGTHRVPPAWQPRPGFNLVTGTEPAISLFLGLTPGDLLAGNVPAAAVQTGHPIDVPLSPDVEATSRTYYTLSVLGPGVGPTPAPGTRRFEVWRQALEDTLLLDFVLPMLLCGGLPATNGRAHQWIESLSDSDVDALYALLPIDEDLDVRLDQGDLFTAAELLIRYWVANPDEAVAFVRAAVRAGVGSTTPEAQRQLDDQGRMAQVVWEMLGNLSNGDLRTLVGRVAQDIQRARPLEEFDVVTVRSRVSLTPQSSRVVTPDWVILEARLHEATPEEEQGLRYRWSTSGSYGVLRDVDGNEGTSFEGTQKTVYYHPRPEFGFGTDTVSVEVAGGTATEVIEFGDAHASVWVVARKPEIRPHRASLAQGDRQDFDVAVPDGVAHGGTLSFVWRAVGGHGTLEDGTDEASTDRQRVTYRCWSDDEATDYVEVEVFETIDGVRESLGTARAEIEITQGRKRTIYGTGRGEGWQTPSVDGWCSGGGGFYTVHPKVEGAIRYDVHCYGFNDTAYWGTSRWYSIDPATAEEGDGGYKVGWFGGAGYGPCAPDYTQADADRDAEATANGYTNSWRIAGIIVEITVVYPPE